MSFFDELTEKAKNVAANAGEKAKEVADSAKISAAILKERRELDKSYLAIGQWFVGETHGEVPEAIADAGAAAKASLEKIQQLKDSREAAEKKEAENAEIVESAQPGKVCPVCGKISDSKFCPHCGAPLE